MKDIRVNGNVWTESVMVETQTILQGPFMTWLVSDYVNVLEKNKVNWSKKEQDRNSKCDCCQVLWDSVCQNIRVFSCFGSPTNIVICGNCFRDLTEKLEVNWESEKHGYTLFKQDCKKNSKVKELNK